MSNISSVSSASERLATSLLYNLHTGRLHERAIELYDKVDVDTDIVELLAYAVAVVAHDMNGE